MFPVIMIIFLNDVDNINYLRIFQQWKKRDNFFIEHDEN